jgi:hypothetical protein
MRSTQLKIGQILYCCKAHTISGTSTQIKIGETVKITSVEYSNGRIDWLRVNTQDGNNWYICHEWRMGYFRLTSSIEDMYNFRYQDV